MATTRAADGTTIDYEIWGDEHGGDDPTVVLVHGITESRESWEPVRERIAARHRVIALDLRGHGRSSTAERYDLEAMAGDVVAVVDAANATRPHLVGHSLGGAVVSAVGAALPVASIVNVDQSLQLADFQGQLLAFEEQLRDPATFPTVIEGIFQMMAGEILAADEAARVNSLRRPDQDVVLGVWDLLLSSPAAEIDATIQAALAGYRGTAVPYLSLFGIDPGPGYGDWLVSFIEGATVEIWDGHGHYPHLVDPDRFVARLDTFWS